MRRAAVRVPAHAGTVLAADCWLIKRRQGNYVWLAICSQNQPPYGTSAASTALCTTAASMRTSSRPCSTPALNRFGNLTDLQPHQEQRSPYMGWPSWAESSLQVLQLGYNKLSNLTGGMLRGMGRLQFLFVQHNLIEVVTPAAFSECRASSALTCPPTASAVSRRHRPPAWPASWCAAGRQPSTASATSSASWPGLQCFSNVTKNYDACSASRPREFTGYPLRARPYHSLNAITVLQASAEMARCPPGLPSHPALSTDTQELARTQASARRDHAVEPPASSTTGLSGASHQAAPGHLPQPPGDQYIPTPVQQDVVLVSTATATSPTS